MSKSLWHIVLAVGIVVIGIYVYHMLTSHKGQSVLPTS
jgi:hypothetical protein